MMTSIIVMLSWVLGSYCSNLLVEDNRDEVTLSAKMVEIILNHHPSNNRTSILLYGYFPDILYHSIGEHYIDIVVMNPSGESLPSFTLLAPGDATENFVQYKVGIIIFYIQNYKTLAESLVAVTQTIFWATDAKMIIHTSEKENKSQIFYMFWWYKNINCIILETSLNSEDISLYTYTPYTVKIDPENSNQHGCWSDKKPDELYEGNMETDLHCKVRCDEMDMDNWSKTMFLQTCIEISPISSESKHIFPGTISDLKGAPLSLLAIYSPMLIEIDRNKDGLDRFGGKSGNLIKILANKMNFTIKHKLLEKGAKVTFTTYLAGFFDLAYRRCDITINMLYLQPMPFPSYDLIYPVEGSGLCFLVHRAEPLATWYNIFKIFDKYTVLAMSLVYQVTAIFFYLFIRHHQNTSGLQTLALSYLYAQQLFLLQPIHWISRQQYIRLFVFLIFWFIFIFNFMFQGMIISYLTVPTFKPEINTFKDLYESNFLIEGFPSPDAFLPEDESEMFVELNKRFKKNSEFLDCANDLRHTNTKGCWLDCLMADVIQKTYRDDAGNLAIHMGSDRIHNEYITYPIWKDSPLTKRIEHYVQMLGEAGLMDKWRVSVMTSRSKHRQTFVKILGLEDLQGCFYILFIGQIISLLSFCLESLFYLIMKKCSKKLFKTHIINK